MREKIIKKNNQRNSQFSTYRFWEKKIYTKSNPRLLSKFFFNIHESLVLSEIKMLNATDYETNALN